MAFYTYDAEDYRITKQVMDSDGEKFTRYFYEGNHVVLEADESGKITAHNTYSINLIGRTVGEEGYYYFYNAHGDVVKLIGIQSEEEILYRYDAFGTLVEVTGDADNSITYAGYQYDKESGLYYLNARYYDSTTARFLTEDTYAGKANDPLSLHRYTYCANNPLRYTDPDGHFFGTLFCFVAGAVVGAVTEYVTQKFIEKRDKINVKAIVYEGVVGGVTSIIGGVGGAAKKAEKTVKAVKSAKTVVKSAIKTGAKEAASGFIEDVGYQVFAEDKSLADVDYGQAIKAKADSGISAMVGELDDAFGSKKQLSATNRKKASQATGLIDDAADAPRPRTNALPDVEVTPSRGAVKNATSGLADAGVGTGSIGRKSNTTTALSKDKLKNAKKSSPSLSKNQQKMQSQTVGSTLSGNTTEKSIKNDSRINFYVAPNGDIVPSTGYRYMDSKYAEQTIQSMNAPGSYFGFEKFDSAKDAQDAFQISPEWSNCKLRGEFDTLQVIDEMYIPKAYGDKGPGLEPFTRCYPEYGKGGCQQFIYKGKIYFKKVDIIED